VSGAHPAGGDLSLRKDSPSLATAAAPFRRLLVANRGEIALRIIRACRELGIESVAVFSDADAGALHVRAADQALNIGPAAPAASYLRVDAIIDAARQTGAQAVHPGYGFLSERPELAEACSAAGVVFVGPPAGALRMLGNKLAARAAAAQAGVPIVPGTLAQVENDTPRLHAEAQEIGYPLLIKAAAGGGGRGMRRVDEPAELSAALLSASAEAESAFGDGAVYLERYVERGRHVEVQLLGDATGRIVALGERDCSTQRRHQKLVEEAPAPGLTSNQRRVLHELAVRVAGGAGLTNAATAEFLLTADGEFWFLEVNARLQVEHGVTELVSGVDLVHEQLRLAAGEPLSAAAISAAARAAEPAVHAIEVRLSAEDPARDFAPLPGRLTRWREPGGPGVRIDGAVEEGSVIGADYDPLLAKLMVVASDRSAAIARLRRALAELDVGGIQTTLPFHRWLIEQQPFTGGEGLSTDLVAQRWQPESLLGPAALRASQLAAQAAGQRSTLPAMDTGDDHAPAWWVAGVAEATEPWS
jgi:acetyl-CoA carboxylase, biotin carboxylase subunit